MAEATLAEQICCAIDSYYSSHKDLCVNEIMAAFDEIARLFSRLADDADRFDTSIFTRH